MRFITVLGVLCFAGAMPAIPVEAESESQTVHVSATILPRLELSINPDTGPELAFGSIHQPAPGETSARSVNVAVNVFSNLGRPYHVTQSTRRPLTNPAGGVIPDAQFEVMAPGARRHAIVPGAPTTLYTSDARGTSDHFLANYSLTVTPETPAGTFGTEIVYTVTSL